MNQTVEQLLQTYLNQLKSELTSIGIHENLIDIQFTSFDYFKINQEGKIEGYIPKSKYMIDNNPNSAELIIPQDVHRIKSILRPNKESLVKYINQLQQVGGNIFVIKPFITPQRTLSIFQNNYQNVGGYIVNIGSNL